MNLLALNPVFLWLLPVALLPVLFHFFFKFRRKTIPFSSFMFFYMIDSKFSAKRKLREYLILLTRVLFLIFILLALAHLIRTGSAGSNTRQSAIIIIDNSSSMEMLGAVDRSKLDLAKIAADTLVSILTKNDQAAIVLTVDDPTVSLPENCVGDNAHLKASIDAIPITQGSGNIPLALRTAFNLLKNSPATRHEIHIFTDMQEGEWRKSSLNIPDQISNSEIFIHRISTEKSKTGNVNIHSIEFSRDSFIVNRSAVLNVTLRNTSEYDTQIQLDLIEDSGRSKAESVLVPKHSEKIVSYTVTPRNSGLHWIRAEIEGDGFSGDNSAVAAYFCSDKKKVLFCDGKKDFTTLSLAISPSGTGDYSGLLNVFTTKDLLEKNIENETPTLTVISWRNLARLNARELMLLKKQVAEGGNLLVAPGASRTAEKKTPSWLNASIGAPTDVARHKGDKEPNAGNPMMILDPKSSFWSGLRDDQGDIMLRNLVVYRFQKLSTSENWRHLLGLENGEPLLATKKLGAGNLYVSALGFSPKDSNLPLKPAFLPLAHKMALLNDKSGNQIDRINAGVGLPQSRRKTKIGSGKKTTGECGDIARTKIQVKSIMGAPLEWNGADTLGFPRTGLYSVISDEAPEAFIIAVSSSPDEGIAKFADKCESTPMLEGMKHVIEDLGDMDSFKKRFKLHRSGYDFFVPLLFTALLLSLLEMVLSNHGKRRFSNLAGANHQPETPSNRKSTALAPLFPSALIQWRSDISPLFSLICVCLIIAVVHFSWKRLASRLPRRAMLMVLIPRIIIISLLMMAFFDPVVVSRQNKNDKEKFLILIDDSSSMDVKDKKATSRFERAVELSKILRAGLPRSLKSEIIKFDTKLTEYKHDDDKKKQSVKNAQKRGTDLAGALAALNERSDISSFSGIVLFTDGGDEKVELPVFPPVPLHIVGVGEQRITSDDLAITSLTHPQESEKDIGFEVSVDVSASFASDLPRKGFPVKITLERQLEGEWTKLSEKNSVMMSGNARVRFRLKETKSGTATYRVNVNGMKNELSLLNNSREFKVNIRKRSLRVLYFTTKLGVNFKIMRGELARDPGISFTALIKTMRNDFIVQGDRITGDLKLTTGFPEKLGILRLYDLMILDSFPAEQWTSEQTAVLIKYVYGGGAAIFLGGEYSFSDGGYVSSPLAPLFPWKLERVGTGLKRGLFPVSIPVRALSNPMIAGLRRILSKTTEPSVDSVNLPGALKPSATGILNSEYEGRRFPIVAINTYGKGKVMGIATNTLWRWATKGPLLRKAYSVFWRQSARNLVEKDYGGESFSVKWDKTSYRPGEQATATIRMIDEDTDNSARMVAELSHMGKNISIPVTRIAGDAKTHTAKLLFKERGEYKFRMTVYNSKNGSENYEKSFSVATSLSEGSSLGVDQYFLTKTAEKGAGTFHTEKNIKDLISIIRKQTFTSKILVETSLTHNTPWFFLVILVLLLFEWTVRKKVNLI